MTRLAGGCAPSDRFAYVVNCYTLLLPLSGFTAQYILVFLRRGDCNLTLTARFAYIVGNNISLLPLSIFGTNIFVKTFYR